MTWDNEYLSFLCLISQINLCCPTEVHRYPGLILLTQFTRSVTLEGELNIEKADLSPLEYFQNTVRYRLFDSPMVHSILYAEHSLSRQFSCAS